MYWITTAALFVFGFSLAFTAVKVLFELPSWLVRSALYVIVTAIYVIALTTSREAGFGWFHLIWSIILMVLIFGLLQKQSSHVCRWSLYIASSCFASLLLYATAVGIHHQADMWLHQVYINRGSTGFQSLILLGFPTGVAIGLLLAWTGTRKDRLTGHAMAMHWSWWCVPWNVGLLGVVVGCFLLNDWVICSKRDEIVARIKDLRAKIELLTPPSQTPSPRLMEVAESIQRAAAPDYIAPFSVPWEDPDPVSKWPTDLDDVLTNIERLISKSGYDEFQKLPAETIVQLAKGFVERSGFRLRAARTSEAIKDIVVATRLVDLGIDPFGRGYHDFSSFEYIRMQAVERLVNSCDASHSELLGPLVTGKPYATLQPPPIGPFFGETQKLDACTLAFRSFTSDREFVSGAARRVSFWWRFLGLRHAIAAAESELDFTLPAVPTDTSMYKPAQFDRLMANAAIRGSIIFHREKRSPVRDELFAQDFSADELKSIAFMQHDDSWSFWRKSQPDDEEIAASLLDEDLFLFFRRRGGAKTLVGPYYQTWQETLHYKSAVGKIHGSFWELRENRTQASAFIAVSPDVIGALQDSIIAGGESIDVLRALQDPDSIVLNLADKWIEIGYCLVDNPHGSIEQYGLQMTLPFNTVDQGRDYVTTLSQSQRKDVAEALDAITDAELRSRYDAMPPDLDDYLRRKKLTFQELAATVKQLHQFYLQAEREDLTVYFCTDPPQTSLRRGFDQ